MIKEIVTDKDLIAISKWDADRHVADGVSLRKLGLIAQRYRRIWRLEGLLASFDAYLVENGIIINERLPEDGSMTPSEVETFLRLLQEWTTRNLQEMVDVGPT